jgi:two-component system CheB/CheR fusion protein
MPVKTNEKTRKLANSGSSRERVFPCIGTGASAGGVEALKGFFPGVSEHAVMAYAAVVHMSRRQPGMMAELLRATRIPVTTTRDEEDIQPDHLYVISPDKDLTIYNGAIQFLINRASSPAVLGSAATPRGLR